MYNHKKQKTGKGKEDGGMEHDCRILLQKSVLPEK
jgi:hypothetical protein